ncbi:pyocin activator PrtN family protein [Acinetobacter baumannii]|uniref:pyocin activator PrtN family protein n=1 Tax=Acinetobacter baumannii TaxID=470 RepID=UPI00391729DE
MKKANFQLNTYTILCMRYLAPAIPLELVAQDYFTHLDIKTIKRRANLQDLPFPVFKLEETKKISLDGEIRRLCNFSRQTIHTS